MMSELFEFVAKFWEHLLQAFRKLYCIQIMLIFSQDPAAVDQFGESEQTSFSAK